MSRSVTAQSVPATDERPQRPRYAAGLQLGTIGPGLVAARSLSAKHRLTARLRFHYLAYQRPFRVKTGDESALTIDPDIRIGVLDGTLTWHPFRRSSFFVAGGGGYARRPDLRFRLTADDKLKFGGLEMTPEDVGTIDARFRWRPLVGYVGTGFGRSIPRKRLGVGVELGMYYLGRPRIDLSYDGFLETTTLDEQLPTIERNLSGYRYLPALTISFLYAIR